MTTQALTKETFTESVTGSEITLIDFWASWCGPCRAFAPVFEKLSGENPDILFAKVDTEAEPELAAAFNITAIPTLIAVKDRTVVYSQAGALPEPALRELVQAVRDVDVTEADKAPEPESAES
jgi:thioredoxin 1